MEQTALITWTTYGTWLPGAARGRIECGETAPPGTTDLPEPDPDLTRARRRALRWPVIQLDRTARQLVLSDLGRIAKLRAFRLSVAVVAADHVHLLIEFDRERDVSRLVQLIKGSLSRTLTAAAGDPPARTSGGAPLPHHKWWSRQYSFRLLESPAEVTRVRSRLRRHGRDPACVSGPDPGDIV